MSLSRIGATDTKPIAAAVQLKIYRAMSPQDRLCQAIALSEASREMAIAGIRARHADATELQRRRMLMDVLLGPVLARLAYGPR